MVLSRFSFFIIAIVFFLISACADVRSKEENVADIAESDDQENVNTDKDTVIFNDLVKTYEDPERGVWQNPDLIIEKFGLLSGKTVADIGAGTGYFSFKLASKGADVVAIDIEEQFLDYIAERQQELVNLSGKISTRLSVPNDPLLEEQEVDFILIVNTYHFLEERLSYLSQLRKGLKVNGKIIIVDFKAGKQPVGPLEEFKIAKEIVEQELNQVGFVQIESDAEALKYQFIITAKK
ncbi:MAG: methyltransferase [Bacteroidota bacterium]